MKTNHHFPRIALSLSILAFAVLLTFTTNAQWIDRIAVGPSAGWVDGGDAKSSIGWGASGVVVLTPNIAIQGEAHWFDELEGDAVTLESVPLVFTLQYRRPAEGITYFAGAGAGYYMFDAEVDMQRAFGPELAGLLSERGFRADADVDDEIGFHVEIGTEISLMEHITAQLAARYLWVETDVDVKSDALAITTPQGSALITIEDESIDLSGAGLFITLRYSF
jgi:hypothetical protein